MMTRISPAMIVVTIALVAAEARAHDVQCRRCRDFVKVPGGIGLDRNEPNPLCGKCQDAIIEEAAKEDRKVFSTVVGNSQGPDAFSCAGYIADVFKKLGYDDPLENKTGDSTVRETKLLEDAGQEVKKPQRGDVVLFYDSKNAEYAEHSGIVSQVDSDGEVTTLWNANSENYSPEGVRLGSGVHEVGYEYTGWKESGYVKYIRLGKPKGGR